MSNSQLNKLKSIKNGTEVTLNLSSNLTGSSNDETNFPHKSVLTNTQVPKIRKTFTNGSSASIKFSKTQLSKMLQLGGFNIFDVMNIEDRLFKIPNKAKDLTKEVTLNDMIKTIDTSINFLKSFKKVHGTGITLINNEIKDIMKVIKSSENRGTLLKGTTRNITSQEGGLLNFLRPLMTAGLPLMKNAFTPLAKKVLLPSGLSVGMSATEAAIQKKIYGSGTTALIISNEEMEDKMKIVKSLEESGLLVKGVSETIKNETKQKGGFLSMLLGTLAASLLGRALTGKGVIRASEGTIRAGENSHGFPSFN